MIRACGAFRTARARAPSQEPYIEEQLNKELITRQKDIRNNKKNKSGKSRHDTVTEDMLKIQDDRAEEVLWKAVSQVHQKGEAPGDCIIWDNHPNIQKRRLKGMRKNISYYLAP